MRKLSIVIVLCLMVLSCRESAMDVQRPLHGFMWPDFALDPYASGFNQITHITYANDGSDRLFVVEREGNVKFIHAEDTHPHEFLDIQNRVLSNGGEQGLLSIAFSPKFGENGRFYVFYTSREGHGDAIISRFHIDPDSGMGDSNSEEILLSIEQPWANHNGGQLLFGPDGYLYIGVGDGGNSGDPENNAQRLDTLKGKILRIDVENPRLHKSYAVPEGNPFHGHKGAREEIWALGLRNPWRFSFDAETHMLYIADVGQNLYEEINIERIDEGGGKNYGWKVLEGNTCFGAEYCNALDMTPPVITYTHERGNCSITGGIVYRGGLHTPLHGGYLYADFCSGRIWGLRSTPHGWDNALLTDTPYFISTFGEDTQGHIYLADYMSGIIYRVNLK